jgi:hypothetical protein
MTLVVLTASVHAPTSPATPAERIEILDPDWPTVEASIRAMDGLARSAVGIDRIDLDEARANVVIGGGGDRLCLTVYLALPDGTQEWFPTERDRGDEPEGRLYDGHDTEFPAKWWVDEASALHAARSFHASWGRDPELAWELAHVL